MNTEDLEKKAKEYAKPYFNKTVEDVNNSLDAIVFNAYLAGAMPRKEQIEELIEEISMLESQIEGEKEYSSSLNIQKMTAERRFAKAKGFLNEFMRISKACDEDFEHDYSELIVEAEQFLKED